MKSRILRLIISIVLLSGYSHAFAEVSVKNDLEDQKRICSYKDGTYRVNTIESNESFLLNAGDRHEIINQVVKKSGSLYFADLSFSYIGNGVDSRYSFQPFIVVYKFVCSTLQSEALIMTGFGESNDVLNGAILNAEVDTIDDQYLVVRAYNTTNKTNVHLYYDFTTKKQFYMADTTNMIDNYNTILDYKPGKNGVGKVLIRFANMKTKLMNYDFHKKIIY